MNAQVRPKPVERQELCKALRFLAIDAVQAANSGHPGMPLGMADIAEVLWRKHLKHNPADPLWPDRDRLDRKSTRLNSSHSQISYAVFCLKKKKDLRATSKETVIAINSYSELGCSDLSGL